MKLVFKNFGETKLVLGISLVVLLVTAFETQGAPFVYANRDLMLCLRKTGQTGGSAGQYEVEINIGQASRYYGAAAGTTLQITTFTNAQVRSAFDNLNDMSWSVGGFVPVATGDATYAEKSLWVTAPRQDPAIAATPWVRRSSTTQGPVSAKMSSIMFNASTYSATLAPNATNNTASVIWVPTGDSHSYGSFVGPLGNYGNTFQGNVENTTASDFESSGGFSRSDLYELKPGTGNGTYLGYFEVRSDASVVFVAGNGTVSPPPPPVLSIARNNTISTISFATTNGASYNLRFTNSAGLSSPVTSWPVVPNVATGDGTVKSVNDDTSDSDRFYSVEAH